MPPTSLTAVEHYTRDGSIISISSDSSSNSSSSSEATTTELCYPPDENENEDPIDLSTPVRLVIFFNVSNPLFNWLGLG